MTTATTSAEMCKTYPGLAGKCARFRVNRFIARLRGEEPEGYSAEQIALFGAYQALRESEVAEERRQSPQHRRRVSVHKKALRAGRRQEAARYGFVIEGGSIRLTGEG